MPRVNPHSPACSAPMLIFAGLMVSLVGLAWPGGARADACSVSLSGISSATAAEHGMRMAPTGDYALDTAELARLSGGAGPLLTKTDKQLSANMKWFHAMQAIVADPATPMLADIQLLYERGREAHEVQLALARSLRCQLGIAGESQQRPETIASLQASHDARVAQARAKQLAEERGQAGRQGFWNAVGTITNVLNAVAPAMNGAQRSAPAGPRDNCGWVSLPGGGGHCELGDGG